MGTASPPGRLRPGMLSLHSFAPAWTLHKFSCPAFDCSLYHCSSRDAERAWEKLDGFQLDGRRWKVRGSCLSFGVKCLMLHVLPLLDAQFRHPASYLHACAA